MPGSPAATGGERDRLWAARFEARRAAIQLARDHGAQLASRPQPPGARAGVADLTPLDGARAARDIELGARHLARGYIRDAREAGHSWQQIGQALGLTPGGDAQQAGDTAAEAAYTYAAGDPDPQAPWRPRSFVWSCRSCEQAISDHGLCDGPADDEQGHAGNCARLAATIAAREAEWEAGE